MTELTVKEKRALEDFYKYLSNKKVVDKLYRDYHSRKEIIDKYSKRR